MPDTPFFEAFNYAADYFSSYFSSFFSVLFDNKVLGFISYLGLILTIYYSLKQPHKSIRYAVAQKDGEYIIAFWNSCNRPIFKEDVFAFCVFVDGYFMWRKVYQDRYEAPFELIPNIGFLSYDEQLDAKFDPPVIRIDLSFDFLNRRRGYIVSIKSDPQSAQPFTTLSIYGKLRGEPPTSVNRRNHPLYLSWSGNLTGFFSELLPTVFGTFYGLFIIYSSVIASRDTGVWAGTIFLLFALIMVIERLSSLRTNKMPFRLRRTYRRFLRSDFKEIRPLRIRSEHKFY